VFIRKAVPTVSLSITLVALSLAAGCAHEEAKPASVPTTSEVVPLPPTTPAPVTNSTIYLSEDFRKVCNVTTFASTSDAPKFDFDRSAILPEDQSVLVQVAQCLTAGALKGRSVRLVGRADPRGGQEYNMALGEHRSNAIMKYLAALGVAAGQMSETSRGALDAKGADESAWRLDRRVDIDILR